MALEDCHEGRGSALTKAQFDDGSGRTAVAAIISRIRERLAKDRLEAQGYPW